MSFFVYSVYRNVSYNNLVGDIPTINNFSRFSIDRWVTCWLEL